MFNNQFLIYYFLLEYSTLNIGYCTLLIEESILKLKLLSTCNI